MKTLTEAQILKLRPEFQWIPNGVTMVEWFEIHKGTIWYGIKSGLCHADEENKSPYHYEKFFVGKGAKRKSLEAFTEWWQYVNSQPYNAVMTFPTKYELGFTSAEIDEVVEILVEHYKEAGQDVVLNSDIFNKKFGINTCAVIDGETIYYHSDVLRTFRLIAEKREMRSYEWD